MSSTPSPAETRLAALTAAYDKLIMGQQVARVMTENRTVEYAQADLPRLEREIAAVRAEAGGEARRPVLFSF